MTTEREIPGRKKGRQIGFLPSVRITLSVSPLTVQKYEDIARGMGADTLNDGIKRSVEFTGLVIGAIELGRPDLVTELIIPQFFPHLSNIEPNTLPAAETPSDPTN